MLIPMYDLLHLPCSNSAPIALYVSMWMRGHGIKIKQHKINLNSNMWETNQRTNMWNKDLKSWKHEKGSKIELYMWKQKQKQKK